MHHRTEHAQRYCFRSQTVGTRADKGERIRMKTVVDRLRTERTLSVEELRALLTHCDAETLEYINRQAREVAQAHFGNNVYIRGTDRSEQLLPQRLLLLRHTQIKPKGGTLPAIQREHSGLLRRGVSIRIPNLCDARRRRCRLSPTNNSWR